MLVCPQCQFDNPDSNKFCQRCGTSLTYAPCKQCGEDVEYTQQTCPHCGALTAKVLLGMVFPLSSDAGPPQTPSTSPSQGRPITQLAPVSPSPDETATSPEDLEESAESQDTVPESSDEESSPAPAPSVSAETFLDTEQRYRFLETPDELEQTEVDSEQPLLVGQVIDTHPLRKSLLDVLIEQGNPESTSNTDEDSFWERLDLPKVAHPYLQLRTNSSHPALPVIYDTWQTPQQAVILLSDRSECQLLTELWATEQIEFLQLLSFLATMAKLWSMLEPVGCCRSLLELDNLRVDEDQSLCLLRLYSDPELETLTLQDLGRTWRRLFSQSGHTQYGPLAEFLEAVATGQLETLDEMRSQLNHLAQTQEEETSDTEEDWEDPEGDEPDEDDPYDMTTVSNQSTNPNNGEDIPTIVLPMQLLSIEESGYTDIGHQRHHNEDHYGIYTQSKKQETFLGKTFEGKGIYLVCDGMGGHAAGEVASAMAVDTLLEYFQTHWQEDELPDQEMITQGILLANTTIYEVNTQNARSGSGRMGTTLVMALVYNTQVAIAHVGDSRIYSYSRKQGLEQLTRDHEVGQREIQRGVAPELAYSRPDAYQLTQALGPRSSKYVAPTVNYVEINEDTLLLLCSDGLSDNDFVESHCQEHLAPLISSRSNLSQGLQKFMDLGNQYNGHDNITAVAVRIKVRPDMSHL